MRTFNKKDFTIVPSRQARIGMPANQQVVYMWLSEHSDDNGQSFPSRKVLAYECGMSPSTLDRTINELVDKGFIVRGNRYKENRQVSNLYTVIIVTKGSQNDEGGLVKLTRGGSHIDAQNSTHRTQPISFLQKKSKSPESQAQPVETAKPSDYSELQPELVSFMEMRQALGKPLTLTALKLVVTKLRQFHPGDITSQKLSLDTATAGCYVLPVKLKPENIPAAAVNVGKLLHPDRY